MINPYRDLDNFISSEINRNYTISQSEIERQEQDHLYNGTIKEFEYFVEIDNE